MKATFRFFILIAFAAFIDAQDPIASTTSSGVVYTLVTMVPSTILTTSYELLTYTATSKRILTTGKPLVYTLAASSSTYI